MYYLGKHKGSPDDTYTHSSTIWESFTKDNIPEGVTRRILAYGTHKEMLALESELQTNRKKRCWDRYYNVNVCDGVYRGLGSGENNPAWKHGVWADKGADGVAYRKEYNQRPKTKAWRKAYYRTPEYREKNRARLDEIRAKNKAETGYTHGYSRAKNNTERQGEGTLEAFL